jgi:hypothetical protein
VGERITDNPSHDRADPGANPGGPATFLVVIADTNPC